MSTGQAVITNIATIISQARWERCHGAALHSQLQNQEEINSEQTVLANFKGMSQLFSFLQLFYSLLKKILGAS